MMPAKRRRFFVHCRGRSATKAARGSDRRCGRSRTGAGALIPRPGWWGGPGRQDELEAAAVPRLGIELDAAAERRRQLVRNREPEAGAGVVPRPERAEDPVALGWRDAGAGVVDGDRHAPVGCAELELDLAAVGRPAKRIREEVRDDLQHAVAVRDDRRARVEALLVADPAAAGPPPRAHVPL